MTDSALVSDSTTMTDAFKTVKDVSSLSLCPRESVHFPPTKKSNKKLMTEQWVASQCDADCRVTPLDLTPLSFSAVGPGLSCLATLAPPSLSLPFPVPSHQRAHFFGGRRILQNNFKNVSIRDLDKEGNGN